MTKSGVRPSPPALPVAPDRGGPRGDSGGGGGDWAWLVTAADTIEAELIRGRLESAGVPVALDRRDPSPGAWLYLSGNVHAPVRVLVPRGLLDAARLELMEAGLEAPIEPEDAPPPQERPRATWILVAVLCAVAVALLVVLQFLGSASCAVRMVC